MLPDNMANPLCLLLVCTTLREWTCDICSVFELFGQCVDVTLQACISTQLSIIEAQSRIA